MEKEVSKQEMEPLTPTQKRYLRSMCHHLKPVVSIGNKGLTEAVIKELSLTLDHHELIKVKLAGSDRQERTRQIDTMLEATGAQLVQQVGHIVGIYKLNRENPQLALPR